MLVGEKTAREETRPIVMTAKPLISACHQKVTVVVS